MCFTLGKAPADLGDALVERVAELDEGVRKDFGIAWCARAWLLVKNGALDGDTVRDHVDLAAAQWVGIWVGSGPQALGDGDSVAGEGAAASTNAWAVRVLECEAAGTLAGRCVSNSR